MSFDIYTDDGWNNVNFNRPGFTDMIERMENGEIKIIVTKNLSRMGQNYLQVEMYTEMVFPRKGVQYIAINDGVDSAQGDNELSGLRNCFDEWMVCDTSKNLYS